MKHELSEKWAQRLLNLEAQEAQIENEPTSFMIWHWQAEIRVTRFLLRRYGDNCAPDDAATADVAAVQSAQLSPFERALLRMALVIPSFYTKHPRPAPSERAAILERIKRARDEGRDAEATDESWLADVTRYIEAGAYGETKARENALRLREREAQWERTRRERKWEEREKRRR